MQRLHPDAVSHSLPLAGMLLCTTPCPTPVCHPTRSAVDQLYLGVEHNPLKRQERLSTGWFGVIVEMEGVLVEDSFEHHKQAWLTVAQVGAGILQRL